MPNEESKLYENDGYLDVKQALMAHNNDLGSSFEEDLSDEDDFYGLSRRESVESDSDEGIMSSIQKSKA